jgi:O-antigen ligase
MLLNFLSKPNLILFFLLPLFMLSGSYFLNMQSFIAYGLLIPLYAFSLFSISKLNVKFDLPLKLITLFTIFFNLSFFFKSTPFGFKEFVGFNTFYLLFLSFSHVKKFKIVNGYSLNFLRILCSIFIFVGFYQIEIAGFPRVAPLFTGDFVFSNYPNTFANFMLFVIPYYLLQIKFFSKSFYFDKILIALNLVLFFLTWSRAGFVAFIVYLALLLALSLVNKRIFVNLKKYLTFVVLILVLTFSMAYSLNKLSPYSYDIAKRVNSEDVASKESLNNRFDFYSASLKLIKDKPFFGFGSGSFQYVYPRYQTQLLALSDHPHNIFLKIMVENGLISGLLFLSFVVSLWVKSIFHFTKIQDSEKFTYFTLFSAFTAMLVHNLLDYNLNFVAILFVFTFCTGLLNNFKIFHNDQLMDIASESVFDKFNQKFKLLIKYFSIMVMVVSLFQLIGYSSIKFEADKSVKTGIFAKLAPFKMQLVESSPNEKYLNKYPSYWPVLKANGEFSKAVELNPVNDIELYYQMYLSDSERLEKDTVFISDLLKKYLEKLKVNAHQTVVSDNPYYAIKLAKLAGLTSLELELLDTYRDELNKFNLRFNLNYKLKSF